MDSRTQKKETPHTDSAKKFAEPGQAPVNPEYGIDKMREFIVGGRMKEIERQHAHVVAKVVEDVQALRIEVLNRVDELESFVKFELKSLHGRLKQDREVVTRQQETLEGEVAELREALAVRSKALAEDFRAGNTRLADELRRELALLNERKLDRSQFSDFLNEWAMRLHSLPSVESDGPQH